jgi:phosphoribosyl-AMP cyclohydrolase
MSQKSQFSAPGGKTDVEEGAVFSPKFDSHGLLPVITVDAASGEVLMFAYMNEKALSETLSTGEAHYWSRSRKELWHKGATSGHVQKVETIRVDCDQDVLQLTVRQAGAACHVGYRSCFYRSVNTDGKGLTFEEVEKSFDPKEVY